MKFFLITLIVIIYSWSIKAQDFRKMFSEQVLLSPTEFAQWFDYSINTEDITEFTPTNETQSVLLENGYVQHRIMNPSALLNAKKSSTPISIDIIFTKYPIKKEDWITNYYELLSNRLKALFAIDESLNSENIRWKLILQTKATTEKDAQKLFHGIRIHFEEEKVGSIQTIPAKPLNVFQYSTLIKPCPVRNEETNDENGTPDNTDVLYPESVWKRNIDPNKPDKNQELVGPPCSKFTTHLDKPKKSKRRKKLR